MVYPDHVDHDVSSELRVIVQGTAVGNHCMI